MFYRYCGKTCVIYFCEADSITTARIFFLSSTEHKVFRVSYCDRAVSGMCCLWSTFYLVYALEPMFAFMKSWTSSKLIHVGSKTSSLGQIIEKPCVHSRGHIFSPILMKLGQNVCLDKIWVIWGSKTRPLCQILEKLVYAVDFILVQILLKLCQNLCLDDF